MIRKATAVWRGTGKDGSGEVSTESGALSSAPYSFRTRFDSERGTNPEELIAAAHAGCFTMALAFQFQTAGYVPTSIETDAAVTLEQDGDGYSISRSNLTLHAEVPGIDEASFRALARTAELNCPVSKLMRAQIALVATLN